MNEQVLLTYYGDDFTGSADVMEVLSCGGVETVLFLGIPDEEHMNRFSSAQAIGFAGTSRSESPEWMAQNLPNYFQWLKNIDAPICHYKVCSTFDSSHDVGNVGRALDIGHALFGQDVTPVVAAAPNMRRYTVFGNHFAAYANQIYRLDRHPVMSVHPVTPMVDADLSRHISSLTEKKIGLVDLTMLRDGNVDARVDSVLADGAEILLFDMLDETTQKRVGEQIWRLRGDQGLFTVGSSGIEYALLDAWKKEKLVQGKGTFVPPQPVDRLAVVSGSCSATTERQILWALNNGFEGIPVNPVALVSDDTGAQVFDQIVEHGVEVLQRGHSVIFYSALARSEGFVEIDKADSELFRHRLGERLGKILVKLVERENLSRAVIAGGDTSSHALQQLEAFALTTRMPLPETPGSPLCVVHSDVKAYDGLEIALKGGQIGNDDYFGVIRAGGGSSAARASSNVA